MQTAFFSIPCYFPVFELFTYITKLLDILALQYLKNKIFFYMLKIYVIDWR